MPTQRSTPVRRPARWTAPAAALGLLAAAAAVPVALADPGADTSSATATAPAATPSSAPGTFALDDRGWLDVAARCDSAQTPVAFGRTDKALVAVCVDPDGGLEYRGVRLSDLAAVSMPAGRAADGAIVATNAGVTYAVSPTMLLVSEGDTVLYRDAWIDYRQPRFSGESPAATTTNAVPTTTVSTTTVTVAPRDSGE